MHAYMHAYAWGQQLYGGSCLLMSTVPWMLLATAATLAPGSYNSTNNRLGDFKKGGEEAVWELF